MSPIQIRRHHASNEFLRFVAKGKIPSSSGVDTLNDILCANPALLRNHRDGGIRVIKDLLIHHDIV